jgi:DNA-nicking Smr family endonuclease
MSRNKKQKAQPPKDGDKGLWDRVKRSVDPLDDKQRARYSQALADYLESTHVTEPTPARPTQPSAGAMKHHRLAMPASRPLARAPGTPQGSRIAPGQPPLVELDRKTRSRIARGRTPIDARLDLHGLRQHEAHEALRAFVWRAHRAGHRTVLVITGKGSRQRDPHPEAPPWAVGSGILRQAVPDWLAAPDLRAAILSVEPAHASHGGEGALYVRLRSGKNKV